MRDQKKEDLKVDTAKVEKTESPPPLVSVTIGAATLYLEDCADVFAAGGIIAGRYAIVTDPPYGLAGAWSSTGGNRITEQQRDDLRSWDRLPESQLLEMWRQPVEIIAWGGNYLAGVFGACRAPLIWDKGQASRDATRGRMHYAEAEIAWTNFDRGTARLLYFPVMTGDQWGKKEHPTQKPVYVMQWSISQLKDDPPTIFDPFMGSGTTGVAAVQMGRSFVGVETNPAYFTTACERLEEAQKQRDLFA